MARAAAYALRGKITVFAGAGRQLREERGGKLQLIILFLQQIPLYAEPCRVLRGKPRRAVRRGAAGCPYGRVQIGRRLTVQSKFPNQRGKVLRAVGVCL